MSHPRTRSTGARTACAGIALAAVQVLTACQGVLDVSLPGQVSADALGAASLAPTLVDGAQADFECAYTEYVLTTSAWSNEMLNSSGGAEVVPWSARFTRPDAGTAQCATLSSNRGNFNMYLPLQIARGQAELALAKLDGFSNTEVANRPLLISRAALYSGYSHLLLSEAFCAVAFNDKALITPAEGLAVAEGKFTLAIDNATVANNAPVLNAARIGRARARVALGKRGEAATDARLVPSAFVFNATYASTPNRRRNTVMENINLKFQLSVAPAYRGLTVGGVADPRVVAVNANRFGVDAITPSWTQSKYPAVDSPLPVATWDEAQLIIAEAEGGQSAIDAINRIRTRYALPQYAGGSAAEVTAQIIEERRRTLFLTGQRIADQLRFRIPFATGVDQKGVRYNDQTCIQLPLGEITGR